MTRVSPAIEPSAVSPQKPARARRLYEQIAGQIEALIETRQLQPGDRLPPERELARLVGASRPSLREAMIALETVGVIDVRTGDGTYVRVPPASAESFARFSANDPGPGPFEQFQARRAIEPVTAAMAAVTATQVEIAELAELVEQMRHVYPGLGFQTDELGERFHTRLAAASRNSILAAVVQSLWALRRSDMWRHLRAKTVVQAHREQVVIDRQGIVQALEQRNAEQARLLMAALLDRAGARYFGGEW